MVPNGSSQLTAPPPLLSPKSDGAKPVRPFLAHSNQQQPMTAQLPMRHAEGGLASTVESKADSHVTSVEVNLHAKPAPPAATTIAKQASDLTDNWIGPMQQSWHGGMENASPAGALQASLSRQVMSSAVMSPKAPLKKAIYMGSLKAIPGSTTCTTTSTVHRSEVCTYCTNEVSVTSCHQVLTSRDADMPLTSHQSLPRGWNAVRHPLFLRRTAQGLLQ